MVIWFYAFLFLLKTSSLFPRQRQCGNTRGSYDTAVGVKDGCLIEVLIGASGFFPAIQNTSTHLEIFEVHFDCAGSQNLVSRRGRSSRLCARGGTVRIWRLGDHFSWQAGGKPRLLQGIGGALCRCADFVAGDGRRSTLDVIVQS